MLPVSKKLLASFFLSMHIQVETQAKIKTHNTFVLPPCPSHILQPAPHSIRNANTVPLHLSSLLLYIPPSPPSPPSTSPAFPSPPSPGRRCQPSRCADVSACLLWYSSIRFAWSPRSGTNNLFNPLIIIRGINKFGLGGCTLNLEPTSLGWNLSFCHFSPCCLVTKGVSSPASLPLPSLPRACDESIKWMRWMLPLYICNIQRNGLCIDKYLSPRHS